MTVGLAAVISVLTFFARNVSGQQLPQQAIEIDFKVGLVSFKNDGVSKSNKKEYLGKCWLVGDQWLLRVHYMDNAVEELYCDGTNVIKKTVQFAEPKTQNWLNKRYGITNAPLGSNQPDVNNTFIRITPGLHPLDNLWNNLPWLAFCSDRYLALPERLIPFPSGWTRFLPNAFGYKDKTALLPGNPGLPLSCVLFASSDLFASSPFDKRLARTDTVLRVRSNPQSIVKNNLMQFEYQVSNWTNLLNRTIPLEFRFIEYRPAKHENATVKLEGMGRVLHTAIVRAIPDIIPVESEAVVTDYRFRSSERLVDSISYKLQKGQQIPNVDDAELLRLFVEVQKKRPIDPSLGASLRRIIVTSLIFILPVGVLVLWYLSAKKPVFFEETKN